MNASPSSPDNDSHDEVSPLLRFLAVAMLVLPIAGLAVDVVLLVAGVPEWLRGDRLAQVMTAPALLAVANLFGSYFHYRRTGMRINGITRILTNLWLLSVLVLIALALKSH